MSAAQIDVSPDVGPAGSDSAMASLALRRHVTRSGHPNSLFDEEVDRTPHLKTTSTRCVKNIEIG